MIGMVRPRFGFCRPGLRLVAWREVRLLSSADFARGDLGGAFWNPAASDQEGGLRAVFFSVPAEGVCMSHQDAANID